MSDQDEKAIRVLKFSGKQDDWNMWSRKFLAMAYRKKYQGVLTGNTPIPKESNPLTNEDEKKAAEANTRAYSDLMLSCSDMITFGIVESAVTNDNPNGDSAMAWKLLKEKYNADTGTTLSKLKKITKSKLEQRQRPDDWIRELERVQTKLKSHNIVFTDNDLMTHIMYHSPKNTTVLLRHWKNCMTITN